MLSNAQREGRDCAPHCRDILQRLFASSLGILVAALGLNIGFYPSFCICSGFAGLLIYRDCNKLDGITWDKASQTALWGSLYLPLFLFLYTALTPGHFLKDLPIASKMVAAWLIGLAAARLPKPLLATSLLFLPLSLTASLVASPFLGYSWEERLCLGFSHPNILGAVSAWSILVILSFRDVYSTYIRVFSFIMAIFCTCGIILSSSRSALFGLVAGIVFLLHKEIRKYFLKVVTSFLICITAAFFLLPNLHATRLENAMRTPFTDATFQSRLPIWEAAWNGFLEAPILGNGVRTFTVWHENYIKQYRKFLEKKYHIIESRIGNPHNFLLGLMYMYGVVGSALFAATFILALFRAWRGKRNFLLSTFLFFLAQGMFEFTLHRKDGIYMLFFPLGLECGYNLSKKLFKS